MKLMEHKDFDISKSEILDILIARHDFQRAREFVREIEINERKRRHLAEYVTEKHIEKILSELNAECHQEE